MPAYIIELKIGVHIVDTIIHNGSSDILPSNSLRPVKI